jgi:hypothetical protein
VVVPVTAELIVNVHSPVVPTVEHCAGPTNPPGPLSEPAHTVPDGAFANPPEPSFTLM